MNINSEVISGVVVIENPEDKTEKSCGCWSAFRRLFRKKQKTDKQNSLSTEDKPKKCCGCCSAFRRLFRKKKTDKRNSLSINDVEENKVKEEQETEEVIEVIPESSLEEETAIEDNVEEEMIKDEEMEAKEDAIEESVEGAVLSLTPSQKTQVKDAVTEDVAEQEDGKKKGNSKNQLAKADVGLLDGVMHVCGEEPHSPTEGWAVVTSKSRRRKEQKALPPAPKESVSVVKDTLQQKATLPAPNKVLLPSWKNTRRAKKAAQPSVRDSWKEEVLDTTLPVAPHMRRCIVGPRGATLQQVHQEFVGVRVTVPPPLDAVTATVRVRGSPRQVGGALLRLKALLHEGELIEAQLAVTPRQRRHVVGPAGATLKKLRQEFPDVAVTVPPRKDRQSCTVGLKGPRRQVTGAQATLNTCLQAATTTQHHAHTHAHRPACTPTHMS